MKKTALSKIITSTSIICSLTLSTVGISFAHELDDIRGAIKSKGAKWSAGETSVSKLSAQEKKLRAGTFSPVLTAPAQTQTFGNLLTATTGTFDWRNIGGNNDVTPVKDQGSCGDCWAFATTAALESFTLINGTYNQNLNLAEQILLSCSGAGSCSGGYIDQASNYFLNTGLPPEADYPYTQTNGTCSTATVGWQTSTSKIPAWQWVATTSPTASTIKNALFTYGPLVTTMAVYSDFFSYQSGIYSYVSGNYVGGHGVLIVGYTDDSTAPGGGYFIVKNSWGTGWGESGYFQIAYSELQSVVQFGNYTIAYNATAPPCSYTISPKGKTFTSSGGSGTVTVTAGNSCAWTASVQGDSSWITITFGSNGIGNGYLIYTVAPTTISRSASIVIKDGNSGTVSTFNISQQRPKR